MDSFRPGRTNLIGVKPPEAASVGARSPQPPACGSSPLRILAVGDCNTAGANATAQGDRVVDQLARRLQAAGLTCTVQNLGHTMSTTREGLERMRRDARPADLVLINFGLVDAWVTSLPGLYLSYYPDNFLKKLARKLLKSLKRRLRRPSLRKWVPVGEVVPCEEYVQNLTRLIDLARRRNPDCRVILWGTVPVRGDVDRSAGIARYNAALRDLADRGRNIWYVDSPALIENLDGDAAYLDHLHLSAVGAERIAAEFARLCLQDGLGRVPSEAAA